MPELYLAIPLKEFNEMYNLVADISLDMQSKKIDGNEIEAEYYIELIHNTMERMKKIGQDGAQRGYWK